MSEASAQDVIEVVPEIVVPEISADPFRPSVDSRYFISTDDARPTGHLEFPLRAVAHYVDSPFVWIWDDGTVVPVVEQATAVSLAAGMGLGPTRLGFTAPLYVSTDGELQGTSNFVPGDLSVDGKWSILPGGPDKWGLGLVARGAFPLGASQAQLGYDGITYEAGILGDYETGPLIVAANVGQRGLPATEIPGSEFRVDDQLWFKLGIGLHFADNVAGVGAEVLGQSAYNDFFDPAASPTELLGSAWIRPARGDWRILIGGGTGMNHAIGSPGVRIVSGLAWQPAPWRDVDGDGLIDRNDTCPKEPEDHDDFEDTDGCPDPDNDADGVADEKDQCPLEPEDIDEFEDKNGCPDTDNDADGLLDVEDRCPNKAEDKDGFDDDDGCPELDNDNDGYADEVDGCPNIAEDFDKYKDEDGCPEGNALVIVKVMDAQRLPVGGSNISLRRGREAPKTHVGERFQVMLDNGPWTLAIEVEGFEPYSQEVAVPAEGSLDVEAVLVPLVFTGFVQVKLLGPTNEGTAGWVQIDENLPVDTADGSYLASLPTGTHQVFGGADGYMGVSADVVVVQDTTSTVELRLMPARVKVTKKAIEITEQVHFETAKAIIMEDSYSLLDEVAQILKDYPSLRKIRVEGHTDSQGGDAYNLKLSQDRAQSVMQYLLDAGVPAERLVSEGFGETQPIADNATKEGRAQNRRVAFIILERE